MKEILKGKMMTYAEKMAQDIYDDVSKDLPWLKSKIERIIADVKRGCIKEVKYGSHGYNVIGAIEDAELEEE